MRNKKEEIVSNLRAVDMDAEGNVVVTLEVKNKLYSEIFVRLMRERIGKKFKVVFHEDMPKMLRKNAKNRK